jgi:hypothetical protein
VPSRKLDAAMKGPFPAPLKVFDIMFRRGTSLFQFYRNAAVLNLDLRLWMMELNDFAFSDGLVIVSRFFEQTLVLPNDVFFTPFWNHFTTRGL